MQDFGREWELKNTAFIYQTKENNKQQQRRAALGHLDIFLGRALDQLAQRLQTESAGKHPKPDEDDNKQQEQKPKKQQLTSLTLW